MSKTLDPSPAFAAEPQGEMKPQEEAVVLDPQPDSSAGIQGELLQRVDAVASEIMEHSVLVVGPTHPLTAVLDDVLPIAADSVPPPDVAPAAPASGRYFYPIFLLSN